MFKWLRICIAILMSSCIAYTFNLEAEERDPFVSIIDLQEQAMKKLKIGLSNVILKGIIWNDSRPVAIINDELVMTGDIFGGFKVERIDKNSVTLSDEDRFYQLFIEEAPPADQKPSISTSTETQEPLTEERLSHPEGMIPGRPGESYSEEDFIHRGIDER